MLYRCAHTPRVLLSLDGTKGEGSEAAKEETAAASTEAVPGNPVATAVVSKKGRDYPLKVRTVASLTLLIRRGRRGVQECCRVGLV